ncbi:glycosyltransferase family 39 protein [Candidatus Woesearchaeota archaeon]|nr:glycosyltransferase family 39 protein [Candidatus Woesearchaeota archaeon]
MKKKKTRRARFVIGLIKNPKFFFIVCLVIFLCFSIHNISLPWQWGHTGFVTTERSEFAINYLKIGYWKTKFAQTYSTGILERGKEVYETNVHHPPTISLYLSLFYLIFGISEVCGRLASVVLCIGILTVAFYLIKRLFDPTTAIVTAFMITLSPILYYVRHYVGPELLASFWITVTLTCYITWINKKNERWLIITLLCLIIGTFTDWQFYFLAPALLLHYLIFLMPKNYSNKFVLIIPVMFFCFFIYVLYLIWVGGSFNAGNHFGGNMVEMLKFRLNLSEASKAYNITLAGLVAKLFNSLSKFYSKFVLISLFFWLINFIYKLVFRKNVLMESIFFFTVFFQILFLFIFSNLFWIHDYLIMLLFPTLIFLVGFFLQDLLGYIKLISWFSQKARKVVALILLLVIFASSVHNSLSEINMIEKEITLVPGEILFLSKNKGQNILVTFDEHPQYHQFKFYANLINFKKISSSSEYNMIISQNDTFYSYIIMQKNQNLEDLENNLSTTYFNVSYNNYIVFDRKMHQGS